MAHSDMCILLNQKLDQSKYFVKLYTGHLVFGRFWMNRGDDELTPLWSWSFYFISFLFIVLSSCGACCSFCHVKGDMLFFFSFFWLHNSTLYGEEGLTLVFTTYLVTHTRLVKCIEIFRHGLAINVW